MGTRAVNLVVDQTWDKANLVPLVNLYCQYDGYPSGHGVELHAFLDGLVMVNGLSGGEPRKIANGAGCLAAQIVKHFKEDPGGIYLKAANKPVEVLVNDGDDCGYVIYVDLTKPDHERIRIEFYSWGKLKFSGSVKEFGEFVNKADADEE